MFFLFFNLKAFAQDHVFSVKVTITAILLCLLVWFYSGNRFQQVCEQPKIAPLNETSQGVSRVFKASLASFARYQFKLAV